jgi:serine/threonine protein phosphatase 1
MPAFVALDRQVREDMLWIRSEFLKHERDFGAIVVHGHSISREVDFQANRIGIDTGAYRSGVLSAVYLEGEKRGILTASFSYEHSSTEQLQQL